MTIKEQQDRARQQKLLTVEQVSLLTQYHVQSVYRMIRMGRVTCVRFGRGVFIPRTEIRVIRASHPRADQSLAL